MANVLERGSATRSSFASQVTFGSTRGAAWYPELLRLSEPRSEGSNGDSRSLQD
jgi:hypothetical protein